MKIAFIGGGNMATAIVGGLLAKGFDGAQFEVVDPTPEQRTRLSAQFGVTCSAVPGPAIGRCDVVVLAVKPQQMRDAAQALQPFLTNQLVISIAAGIRLDDLSVWLGGHANLVRAMPNTPALIHAGVTGLFAPLAVTPGARESAATLLGAVGATVWFAREDLLDAVTAVSGSGPAYVFYFIEALQQAGEQLGMTPDQARTLALHTFAGASRLAAQSPEAPAVLRARVTSKGGTTEAAIASMKAAQVQEKFITAVAAAAARSHELGLQMGNAAERQP